MEFNINPKEWDKTCAEKSHILFYFGQSVTLEEGDGWSPRV